MKAEFMSNVSEDAAKNRISGLFNVCSVVFVGSRNFASQL